MANVPQVNSWFWVRQFVLAYLVYGGAGIAFAAVPTPNPAASLLAKHEVLRTQLGDNQFHQPMHLESTESTSQLKGDIYALVDYPFANVNAVLNNPASWCDVLILHINTKYCRASTARTGTRLTLNVGKKYDQPLDDAYRIEFAYRAAAATPEYFEIHLHATTGPLGTKNYRILLEGAAVEAGRPFLHLTYSYDYGVAAVVAMQTYLATAGRSKVGFTIIGKQPNGQPKYIDGVRGVVERNTMRYYLAIDAFLGALGAPLADQFETRLHTWFNSTERYPRQLREVNRTTYLDMKRHEYVRQQTAR